MTTSTDISALRGKGVTTAEQARAAVKEFRRLQPTLNSYARNLTGRRDVVIEMAVQDNGSTDGKRIFYRPPMALGEHTEHQRTVCGKRDRTTGEQRCKACAAREDTLVTIYHEIAHICFESFAEVDIEDAAAVAEAARAAGGPFAEAIADRIRSAPEHLKRSYIALCNVVSPFMPLLWNALEDARVNAQMFQARPGTKVMFDTNTQKIFRDGVEQVDPENGEIIVKKWDTYPLNMQVLVGLFCKASGYQYETWFTERVVEALNDDEIAALVANLVTVRSAAGVYSLSFPLLKRLRELGFCIADEDPPEPEPEPDEKDEDAPDPEDASDSPDSSDDGDDGPGDGDSEGEEGSAEGPDSEDGDTSSSGSGSGGEEEGESESDDDPDGRGADGSDEGSDSAADSEGGDGEEDSGGTGPMDDSPATGDSPDDAGSPDGESAGDSDLDGAEVDADSMDSSDSEGDAEGEAESGITGTGDIDGAPVESGTGGDLDADTSTEEAEEEVAEGGDGEPGTEGEPGQTSEEDLIDSGADDGTGGTLLEEDSSNDDLPMGTPEEVKANLMKFGDHEEKPKTMQEKARETEENNALETAILQGIYFETPSRNITGVREHRWGAPVIQGGFNFSQAWDDEGFYAVTYGGRGGKDSDTIIPESVLGPALLRMRVAFSDNERGSHKEHLKSGRVNGRVLGKRAHLNDPRLFRKKVSPGKKSYFVILGMDVSGSTVGRNIVLEKRAVMAQATLCHRMGIPFAIYAHSGNFWKATGGRADGLALDVYLVKEPNEPWDKNTQERLTKLGPDSANLDGHFLEYLRKVADTRPETDKIIMYYSDGKMPAENHDEELEILRREITTCKQKNYTLLGVGIRTDSPARHGLDTVQVDTDEDTGKVVRHLEKRLLAK